jgi:micrococcal nuclease
MENLQVKLPDSAFCQKYDALVWRVIDGDTYEILIDIGFDVFRKLRVRLYGCNCPETRGKSKQAGLKSKAYVTGLLEGKHVTFLGCGKTEKFGRTLARIVLPDSSDLTNKLVSEGYAIEYYGTND